MNKGGQPKRTYLGGIRTVEDFRLRSWIDPDTGCWVWKLSHHKGTPVCSIVVDGRHTRQPARRAVLVMSGKKPQPDQVALLRPICTNLSCVNPRHAMFGPKAEVHRLGVAAGKFHNPLALNRLAVFNDMRRKVTLAQAEEIANDPRSGKELAPIYGIHKDHVNTIRRRFRREVKPPIINSVFNLGS